MSEWMQGFMFGVGGVFVFFVVFWAIVLYLSIKVAPTTEEYEDGR